MDATLLNVRDVAKMLGLSPRTIWALHASGRIPKPVRISRSVRWRADELKRWVEAGCPSAERFAAEGRAAR